MSETIISETPKESKVNNIGGSETIGLSFSPDIDNNQPLDNESVDFDPVQLLELEKMPVEDFFKLPFEKVYDGLRRTNILPDDNPNKVKAWKIIDTLREGKDNYLKNTPGSEDVTF
jgi:hypothetical protein